MFNDAVMFASLGIVLLILVLTYLLRGRNWVDYFKTKPGRQALYGLIVAPLAALAAGLIISLAAALVISLLPQKAKAGEWFNEVVIFAGIDYTLYRSPMCEEGEPNDNATSNMGMRFSAWRNDRGTVQVNATYIHHSCVINGDDFFYDAPGFQVEWVPWRRNR